jgi:hypothetical protein
MRQQQTVTLAPKEGREIVFTFGRTVFNHREYLDKIGSVSATIGYKTGSGWENYSGAPEIYLIPGRTLPFFRGTAPDSVPVVSIRNVSLDTTMNYAMNINSKMITVAVNAKTIAVPTERNPNYWNYFVAINADDHGKQDSYTSYVNEVPQLQTAAFNEWYIQKDKGDVNGKGRFDLTVLSSPLQRATLVNEDAYSLTVFSAQARIVVATIYLADAHRYLDMHQPSTSPTLVNVPGRGVFSNDHVQVSSVPYDLTGTGI